MKIKHQLRIKSLNKDSLNLYKSFLEKSLKNININFKIFNLPTKKQRVTLLKSPHVNKAAREQFEIKYYTTTLEINSNIENRLLKFLILNKPKTITISIKRV
jgi:small subunit ribosomal protein S10